MALLRRRDAKLCRLLPPKTLHLERAIVVFRRTNPAAAGEALAAPCSGVDIMKIRSSTYAATCTGDWSRTKYLATDRTMQPADCPRSSDQTDRRTAGKPVCLSIMMPLMSLSHPPRHVEGVQPLTKASTHVSRSVPSCLVESTCRRTARNSPQQQPQSDKW